MDNTAAIYCDFMTPVKFLLIDGDKSHLNGVIINSGDSREQELLESELIALLFNEEGYLKDEVEADTFRDAVKDGCKMIVCGFVP